MRLNFYLISISFVSGFIWFCVPLLASDGTKMQADYVTATDSSFEVHLAPRIMKMNGCIGSVDPPVCAKDIAIPFVEWILPKLVAIESKDAKTRSVLPNFISEETERSMEKSFWKPLREFRRNNNKRVSFRISKLAYIERYSSGYATVRVHGNLISSRETSSEIRVDCEVSFNLSWEPELIAVTPVGISK